MLPLPAGRRPGRQRRATRARQRGVFGYLFAITMAATTVALATGALGLLDRDAARRAEIRRLLLDAKALVVAHLSTPDPSGTRRLGRPGPLFDLPVAGNATYDGLGEPEGLCAFRGWTPGQPLRPVATSAAAARCFGRLAWRELGLVLSGSDASDPAGMVPWVAVSQNLATDPGCLVDLNPLLLGTAFVAHACDNRPPYPWLRVVDDRGRLLSDRVAVVLIAPGPVLANQTRTPNAAPSAWLDGFTLLPGCATPCVPGTYGNGRFDHADNLATTFVAGPADDPRASRAGAGYAQPLSFNDRLIWITVDELFAELEKRARVELLRALKAFRDSHHHYPYAAPFDSAVGACQAGLRFGHPPAAAGTCGPGQSPSLAAWFTLGGWHRYFAYSVSNRCHQGDNACTAPGLSVGSDTGVNALIISPGVPITSPPYAVSRGAPQRPLNGPVLSADPRDYLDTVVDAAGASGVFASPRGAAPPANDRLEIVP